MIKIKVCGMRDPVNIREAQTVGVDMMGFIFYPGSSRYVGGCDPVMTDKLTRVGVFVNENSRNIVELAKSWKLDLIQLHGDETPAQCGDIKDAGLDVVKAFSVGEEFDFAILEEYIPVVDFFLFDTKGRNYGGNGYRFDWQILDKYTFDVPFWLSGGIGPEMVSEIKALSWPMLYAVDVNSGFEERPGYKNIKQLKKFVDELQG